VTERAGRGAGVVLSEGGPSFNAQFADAGLIDELCLSIAPLLAGGNSPRIVHGSLRTVPLNLTIDHLLEASDTLFVRYVSGSSDAAAG
ncbi:MAG: dihydrofolate reductase family protein, partial [Acidimicrobiaceae bacterium]|nr:dihydrofolate reductase family protein [Acidimicrobiaceae bacterium]